MQDKFKYRAAFSNQVTASSNLEESGFSINKASLDSLSKLVPEDIDLEANVDLLAVAFNAAVVNKFNKNDDGIDTATALAVSDYFVHKPTNIEHQKRKVVGHIVSSGFSKFGGNEVMTKEEVAGEVGPFNIALGAVIYKTVNREFADLVEKSAHNNDDMHHVVSASWEIGFNDYVIALGSRDLKDAEIIKDENQIKEFSKYLKAFDGEGKLEDGTEVYRLVTGNVYPLGIGFTSNPAAEVKGLYLKDEDKKKAELIAENLESEIESIVVKNENFLKKLKNYKKNFSHMEETHVISDKARKISDNQKNMEMKDLVEQLKETIEASSSDKFSEEAVANIVKVVSDVIRQKSDEYVQEKAELEKAQEEVAKAKEEADSKLNKLEEELAASQEKLSSLEAEQKAAKALQLFNARMEDLDNTYDFSDEDRKIIANDLKDVEGSDEAYATYQERLSVIYKHKSKEFLADQEKTFEEKVQAEVEKKIADLGSEEVSEKAVDIETETEEVLAEVETSEEIPSNNGESTEKELSLSEKFASAFNKDSVTINY